MCSVFISAGVSSEGNIKHIEVQCLDAMDSLLAKGRFLKKGRKFQIGLTPPPVVKCGKFQNF